MVKKTVKNRVQKSTSKKSIQKSAQKKISELVKQAENTIRSVQYKLDDPCEPPNPPKILEKNPCKEFPK